MIKQQTLNLPKEHKPSGVAVEVLEGGPDIGRGVPPLLARVLQRGRGHGLPVVLRPIHSRP